MVNDHAEQDGISADEPKTGHSRRKFMVAGTATWASVALAGCAGSAQDDEDDGEGEEEVANYVVTDDMIAGSEGIPEGTGGFASACAPQRTFVPGMQPVFQIGVWDPETGDAVGDDVVDEATAELDLDESIDLEWDDEDAYWGGSWIIPDDADTGTVGYVVEVTNEGEFTNVGVLESEFEIIELDNPGANFVVTDDVYAIDEPEEASGFVQSCTPQHTFTSDMEIGFAIGIYDGSNGEIVGDDVVDEAVIETETDDTIELEWDDEDEEWAAVWRDVPDDFEGELTYEVQVTVDGEYQQVGIFQNSINIIEAP